MFGRNEASSGCRGTSHTYVSSPSHIVWCTSPTISTNLLQESSKTISMKSSWDPHYLEKLILLHTLVWGHSSDVPLYFFKKRGMMMISAITSSRPMSFTRHVKNTEKIRNRNREKKKSSGNDLNSNCEELLLATTRIAWKPRSRTKLVSYPNKHHLNMIISR